MTAFCRTYLLPLLLSLSLQGLRAQLYTSKYEIGLSLGTLIYQGDLTPSPIGSFRTPGWVLGADVSRLLNQHFSLRQGLSRGALYGNDAAYALPAWRRQRNFKFDTPVTELDASLVAYPIGHSHRVTPYILAGLGVAFVNIRRDYSRFNGEFFSSEQLAQRLAIDLANPLPRAIPVLPLGIGIRYPITKSLSLRTEASYRLMNTDYLDGFSRAGNPARNDHYSNISVGVSYRLGVKEMYDCPRGLRIVD